MGKKKQKAVRRLADADAGVAQAVEPAAKSPPVRLLALASEIGDQPQLRALCIGAMALGLVRRDSRLAVAGLRALAAHELATLAKDFVKHRVDRTRPRSFLRRRNADHKPKPGRRTHKEETSFPSGHAAGATAVARALARDYPSASAGLHAAAAAVALAQIPRCAHYPTDVGAGIGIGLLAELAVSAMLPPPSPTG